MAGRKGAVDVKSALARAYEGKRVLLTGHTGFKGSWASVWLERMGAQVFGYALKPNTSPAMFDLLCVNEFVDHRVGDVRDRSAVFARVSEVEPDIIFHMAAQPIVRESYQAPLETLETNVMGTANVLEAVRQWGGRCAVVVVTSDKCYDNKEWVWGYRETDPLGGNDPYSMSKAAAELVTQSWRRSFFPAPDSPVQLASGRAGNVIGGGDWAPDRILTDSIAALTAGKPIRIRNPLSTRPWQHVLEPLSGYFWLGRQLMFDGGHRFAGAWNLGPDANSIRPVKDFADLIITKWGSGSWEPANDSSQWKEAMSLSLNCDRAAHQLGWRSSWSLEQCIARTIEWYRAWAHGGTDLLTLTRAQIASYELDGQAQGQAWAQP
jgi:CDP-glucose 4,6-dehydratase